AEEPHPDGGATRGQNGIGRREKQRQAVASSQELHPRIGLAAVGLETERQRPQGVYRTLLSRLVDRRGRHAHPWPIGKLSRRREDSEARKLFLRMCLATERRNKHGEADESS